jgi:hypothetical protein
MTFLYCLVHSDPAALDGGAPEELGFYSSPDAADAARRELLNRRHFAKRPDGFVIVPFRLDDQDEDRAAAPVYFGLHYDGRFVGRNKFGAVVSDMRVQKTLAVFSSGIRAAEALVVKMHDPDWATYPWCFSITQGTVDQPDWMQPAA